VKIKHFERMVKAKLIIGLFVGCQSLNVSASEVVLAWDPPVNNVDGTTLTDLTGYKLSCGPSSRSYSIVLEVGNTNTCKVTDLVQGSTYFFAVTACSSNNLQSDYSTECVWLVPDTTAPMLSVVAPVTLNTDASGLVAVPNLVRNLTVTDNCSPSASVLLTQTPAAGALVGAGINSVLLTATDEAGNSAQATVLVTVVVPPSEVVSTLPAPWNAQNIGTGIATGNASFSNNIYSVRSAGNISGTADKFYFVYQALSGDGEIKARVAALQNTGTGAKAGIMIRESLTSGSRCASLSLLANGQVEFLRRSSTGGSVKSTVSTGSAAPNNWIRLVRSGQKITAYKSSSGTTWTSIGSQSITMASTISFGLVTASGNTNTLSTATIANVSVVP
jgi:hypothetical protein